MQLGTGRVGAAVPDAAGGAVRPPTMASVGSRGRTSHAMTAEGTVGLMTPGEVHVIRGEWMLEAV